MPPNKRIHKQSLKLQCEWSSCQETFHRMENFCKHVESHICPKEEEKTGGTFSCINSKWLLLTKEERAVLVLAVCRKQ